MITYMAYEEMSHFMQLLQWRQLNCIVLNNVTHCLTMNVFYCVLFQAVMKMKILLFCMWNPFVIKTVQKEIKIS